jgi:TonB family protein
MKSRMILTCVFILLSLIVKGQTVINLRFEQSGKMIDVYYDLSGKSDELFQIRLYCSQNGGKTWGNPLNYVSGAVGENIKPGTEKKITWDVLKENEKLVGEVRFKVESTPASGSHQVITGQPGDQGKPGVTTGSDNYDSSGGSVGGVSFDLAGRSSRQIPGPNKNFKDRGTVVVTIFVNRAGIVTRVISGAKGTTTSNIQLRQLAEQAAKQARFSPKEDAPAEQKGSITYIFELN